MPKDLTFNEDVRKKILSGMEKVNWQKIIIELKLFWMNVRKYL